MADLVAAWLDYLRLDRDMSPNTLRTYARTLRTLPGAATASREDVEAWWTSRADLARSTRVNELAALHAFYRWMLRWEHRTDDPTARIDNLKLPARVPQAMSRAEFHQLLSELAPDLARAVALGGYAGLRISEAAAADWSWLDVDNDRIRVTGKGGKIRHVTASLALLDVIRPDTGGNIVTAGGHVYTAGALQRRVNRAIAAKGMPWTFHALRHRFGTVAAGVVPLTSVARAMGHSSIQTTALYVSASDSDLDLIAEAVAR